MKRLILKIADMHCASCAMNIDGELEDTEGVKSANTSYAKAETVVEFDEEKVSEAKILKIVKGVGYTAKPT